MLTATDVRTPKTANIEQLYFYNAAHRHTSMCKSIVKIIINSFFSVFAVFEVQKSATVNVCINYSFLH